MNQIKNLILLLLTAVVIAGCQNDDHGLSTDDKVSLIKLVLNQTDDKEESNIFKGPSTITLPQSKKDWTVLVYLDADNNLSQFSTDDVKEMIKTGSGKNLNIVLLWDNDPRQDEPSAPARHGYYYVEKNGVSLLKDAGEVNMGSAATAKNFITYAVKNFPSDHYLWVYWNHGGAVDRTNSLKGVSWDDTNGGDHLSEIEQKEIMQFLKEKIGKKIDIVGFDACLMATVEIAYQYADTASYLVASEQVIPGQGWDYRFLEKIKASPTITPVSVTKHILAYYKKFYASCKEEDVTLSVLNLASAENFIKALDAFTRSALAGSASGTAYKAVSKGLDLFGAYNDGSHDCYYTKDLYCYLSAVTSSASVPDDVKVKADACMKLLANKKFIINECHGAVWNNAALGLAVTLKYATSVYKNLDLCADSQWDEFLNWAGFSDNDYAY